MYHILKDEKFINAMKRNCSNIMGQLVKMVNDDIYLQVRFSLVGSGKRNLITQNTNESVDLDYNLYIEAWDSDEIDINDCKWIKNYIKNCFNKVLRKNKLHDCKDSKTALTTHLESLPGFNIKYSIDLCIVLETETNWHRLVHKKTGNDSTDQWYWNEGKDFSEIHKKEQWIKQNDLWDDVVETYLNKKNMYLTRNDHTHPSFVCYIESINEVYNKN